MHYFKPPPLVVVIDPLCDYIAVADSEIHALVSNGRRGQQQMLDYLKCQSCGGCRTSRYGTPLYWLKTPLSRIAMVMTAMSEGVDISAARHIFGHHQTTITHWIERCGRHSERLHERLFHRALTNGHLQLDELVTKVKQDTECIWIWTAVAARSKLILALHIGRRSSDDAHRLLHQVWQRLVPDTLPILPATGSTNIFMASRLTSVFGISQNVPENFIGFRTYVCNMLNCVNVVKAGGSLSSTALFAWAVVSLFTLA
ncbi:MAG: transposase [Anaerolineaceae bacterium]|nr:transposase [Anaerolineaceae bacterium]